MLFATPEALAFHLDDTLRGATTGNPIGGSFDADGWHVTDRTDRIWYALPRLVSGSVEFTVSNITMASLGTVDNELFAMYEAGYGIAEPIQYAPYFRNNFYKCMLRVFGNAEVGREGQQKLMWGMCPGGAPGYDTCGCGTSFFEEPFGGSGVWDGTPQRFRIEWGGGTTRYLRNGSVVITIDWSASGLTFGPQELHLSLGTSRPSAVDYAQLPVGAVFSDLVIDGVGGELSICPGVPVVDAGTTPTDSGSTTGFVVIDLPAIEDVTVAPTNPTTVYSDVNDLSVGAADSEFYVKFRLNSLPGRVLNAQLLLNSAMNPSATGSGASVFRVASDSWSETTLVWNARPGPAGARLARVDGISVDEPYAFDLPPGLVSGPGVYAFAVLPETTDTNAAHFDSKEVSAARGPILRLTVDPSMPVTVDAGADAADVSTDAPLAIDAQDARDASAHPMDAGADARIGPAPQGGCACRSLPGSSSRPAVGGLVLLALLSGSRRRRIGRLRSA